MNWKSGTLLLMTGLLLAACSSKRCLIFCHDGTEIQSGYVVARNDCQGLAEDLVSDSSGGFETAKARNAELLENFARCMKQKGWGVTSPKRTSTRPGGPNDNTNLAGDPWAPTPYGARQAIVAAPAQAYGYYPQPAYGYAPYPPPQAYGYGYVPVPMPQAYGYAPVPQQQPQQRYRPAPDEFSPNNEGFSDGNSNRAGIGLAPGF